MKNILTGRLNAASLAARSPAQDAAAKSDHLILDNGNHRLEFDPQTAQLRSLRAAKSGMQEFIPPDDHHPVFTIEYLDPSQQFQQVNSTQAKEVHVRTEQRTSERGQPETVLTGEFFGLGGLDLSATVTVTSAQGDP